MQLTSLYLVSWDFALFILRCLKIEQFPQCAADVYLVRPKSSNGGVIMIHRVWNLEPN